MKQQSRGSSQLEGRETLSARDAQSGGLVLLTTAVGL